MTLLIITDSKILQHIPVGWTLVLPFQLVMCSGSYLRHNWLIVTICSSRVVWRTLWIWRMSTQSLTSPPRWSGVKQIVLHWRYVGSWWCYDMETLSALLALAVGNALVTSGSRHKGPVMRTFDDYLLLAWMKLAWIMCPVLRNMVIELLKNFILFSIFLVWKKCFEWHYIHSIFFLNICKVRQASVLTRVIYKHLWKHDWYTVSCPIS